MAYFYTFSSDLFLFEGKKAIKNIESNGAILHIYIIKSHVSKKLSMNRDNLSE